MKKKKTKYKPNIIMRFTTTNFAFRNKLDALYQEFKKIGKDFSSHPRET